MKFVCCCDHGQTRSVAMANVLREHKYCAVATSYKNYCDHIDEFKGWTLVDLHEEGEFFHIVGRDEWGDPCHPELLGLCALVFQELTRML